MSLTPPAGNSKDPPTAEDYARAKHAAAQEWLRQYKANRYTVREHVLMYEAGLRHMENLLEALQVLLALQAAQASQASIDSRHAPGRDTDDRDTDDLGVRPCPDDPRG